MARAAPAPQPRRDARAPFGDTARVVRTMQPVGRSFRHYFEGPFWRRVFLWGVRNLPQELQRRSMPMWAGIFHTLVPSARRAAERNLERVAGPLPRPLAHARSFRLFTNYAQAIT